MKYLVLVILVIGVLIVSMDTKAGTLEVQMSDKHCEDIDYQVTGNQGKGIINSIVFHPCSGAEIAFSENSSAMILSGNEMVTLMYKGAKNRQDEMIDQAGFYASNAESVKRLIQWKQGERPLNVMITGGLAHSSVTMYF